ncbi:MAG: hypothetical protein ACRD18_02150 [Terriglobia bacterium]
MGRRIHNKNQIEGDPAARQEGFGSAAEREDQGSGSAVQSGDLQGLSGVADADSESVEELIEGGQFYEAEVVSGIEHASDAAEEPAKTREVPEDDVPGEYRESGGQETAKE